MRAESASIEPYGDIAVNLASFTRALAATNLSPRTIQSYTESTQLLARFLAERGMPTSVAQIRREHLEAFVASLLAKWKPATAHNERDDDDDREIVRGRPEDLAQGCAEQEPDRWHAALEEREQGAEAELLSSGGAGQAHSRTDGERVERERQDESEQRWRGHLQIISAVPQNGAIRTEGAATIAGAAY